MNFRERLKKNREERQEKRRRMTERAAPLLEYESLEGEYREWKRREEGEEEEGGEEEGGMVEKREQMIEKREQMVFSSPSRSRSSLQKFCFEYEGLLRIIFVVVALDVLWVLIALGLDDSHSSAFRKLSSLLFKKEEVQSSNFLFNLLPKPTFST